MAAIFRQPIVEHPAAILHQGVVPGAHGVEHPGRIDDLAQDAVLIETFQAGGGVTAGGDELCLQCFIALDQLVDAAIFVAGEVEAGFLAVMFIHHARHRVAMAGAERLGPQIARLEDMGIAGYDSGIGHGVRLPG